METDRATSKIGDRPITRWRRDRDRPSTGVSRPQSKIERPMSRRGTQDDTSEYGISGNYRVATPSRNALARPPTSSMISNRVSTAGSRLAMNSGVALNRINTGLSSSGQMNMNVAERPITQHGIAGVRPGTTRGLSRQIQDKRYYESLLQVKIRELTQETAIIKRDIDNQNKERATFLHLDKRAKELAAELTALQGELADYNIVVDKMTSNVEKEYVEQEARELARKNEFTQEEIEQIFEQRREMEQELRRMEKHLEEERKSTERLIENMDPKMRENYDKLYKKKTELQSTIDNLQKELDELSKEQGRFEEQIALSPLKQEAVKLHIKIAEAEEKRDKLKEEVKNKLSPELEKEQLMQKIKRDNLDITAAEAELADKRKRVAEAEQELEELETELEGNQSEKHAKYKELRKREEVIEQFMTTFEENKKTEIEKLGNLEKNIVERLETISSGSEMDIHLTVDEETAILNTQLLPNYENVSEDQDIERLKKEHTRLQQTLNKMESLEKKLKAEYNELKEKVNTNGKETVVVEDSENANERSETNYKELTNEHKQLISEQSEVEKELKTVQAEYNEIKERLYKIDGYQEIDVLEEKLEQLKQENKKMTDFITKQKESVNYLPLRDHAFTLVAKFSAMLKETLKPIY